MLATGTPADIKARTGTAQRSRTAFVALLPEARAPAIGALEIPPRAGDRGEAGDRGARPDPPRSAISPRSTA